MVVKIINKSDNPLPKYETAGSAGMDIRSNNEESLVFMPGDKYMVSTGIYLEVPDGYEAQIRARSGLAAKHGITVLNGVGTIDSDYRGEIKVILVNLSDKRFTLEKGERIAQIVFSKVFQVNLEESTFISETERGEGGFGSTGKN